MFLSEAQLNLIDTLHDLGQLDLLEANISTVSALSIRGVVQLNIAKRVNDTSTVSLTDVGEAIAEISDQYRNMPRYLDLLAKTRKVKYGHS